MKKKTKKSLILLSINLTLIFSLCLTFITPPLQPNVNLIKIKNPSLIFNTLGFTLQNLWYSGGEVFFAYQNQDGTFEELGEEIYPSFNAWSFFSMLEITNLTKNETCYNNYALPSLEFVLNHCLNKTNYGIRHWCFKNGSIPSIGDIENYNSSTEAITTYQAWTILALLNAYKMTDNASYRDDYAIPMLDFMLTNLWDAENNSFYLEYYYDGNIDETKNAWYEQWSIISLLEAYDTIGNITYLENANKTLDFLLTYLWDDSFGGFFIDCQKNGSDPTTIKSIVQQAGGIACITKAVEVLKNYTLIDDYLIPTINFTLNYLWNDEFSQFVTNTSREGIGQYLKIRPSEISFFLKSILEIPKNFNLSSHSNYLLKSMKNLIQKTRVQSYFCKEYNLSSGNIDLRKWTIEQVFPLIVLSKMYDVSTYDSLFTSNYWWFDKMNPFTMTSFYKYAYLIENFTTIVLSYVIFALDMGSLESRGTKPLKIEKKKKQLMRRKI